MASARRGYQEKKKRSKKRVRGEGKYDGVNVCVGERDGQGENAREEGKRKMRY